MLWPAGRSCGELSTLRSPSAAEEPALPSSHAVAGQRAAAAHNLADAEPGVDLGSEAGVQRHLRSKGQAQAAALAPAGDRCAAPGQPCTIRLPAPWLAADQSTTLAAPQPAHHRRHVVHSKSCSKLSTHLGGRQLPPARQPAAQRCVLGLALGNGGRDPAAAAGRTGQACQCSGAPQHSMQFKGCRRARSEVRRHRQQEQQHPQQPLSGTVECAVLSNTQPCSAAISSARPRKLPLDGSATGAAASLRDQRQSRTTLAPHKQPGCRSLGELREHELLGQLVSRVLVLDHVLHSGTEAAKQVRKGWSSASLQHKGAGGRSHSDAQQRHAGRATAALEASCRVTGCCTRRSRSCTSTNNTSNLQTQTPLAGLWSSSTHYACPPARCWPSSAHTGWPPPCWPP